MSKLTTWFYIVAIMCLGLFLYRFNLDTGYIFKEDTARDMLAVLRLYQNKKLTLIGPPISLGQYGTHVLYFGSLHYYIGMAGLLLQKFQVTAATIPNALLMLIAIPMFYALTASATKKSWQRLLATAIFAASPVSVIYTRIFWNPSPILSLSVFFWLCFYYTYSKKRQSLWIFLAGMLVGIIFNLHYFAALPLLLIPILRIKSWRLSALWFVGGFILASMPLILFEFRHSWYLTQGFIQHLTNGTTTGYRTILNRLSRLDHGLLVPFGIYDAEFHYKKLLQLPRVFTASMGTLLCISITLWLHTTRNKILHTSFIYAGIIVTTFAFIMTALASGFSEYFMRYLFAIYPFLLFLVIFAFLNYKSTTVLLLFLTVYALVSSLSIIVTPARSPYGYIPIREIEKISTLIRKDNPKPPYNITENIIGDAQATAFRYFLERDTAVKPASEKEYENLNTLYVITQSEQKTLKEQRWEFTATKGLHMVKKIRIDNEWLLVYRK
ncbi:MAG: hypothetical protein NUV65_03685 [Candidatus Roizmanbacteria bacterium]|nr:hypothetical protein [Candidatus Roizmanbacteria bacterium]